MKSLSKNLPLIAGVVVVLGAIVYMVWLRPVPLANVTVSGTGPMGEAYTTFLALSEQLEPGGFNAAILEDPRFLSLVDIKTAIVPEQSGRIDPFAALSF